MQAARPFSWARAAEGLRPASILAYHAHVQRDFIRLVCLLALVVLTWIGARPEREPPFTLAFEPLALPASRDPGLGAFRATGAWRMTSLHPDFGGYSALVPLPDGRLLAASDAGKLMTFAPPPRPTGPVVAFGYGGRSAPDSDASKRELDLEAMTIDQATGTVWAAFENVNALTRVDAHWREVARVHPPAMSKWRENTGAEAMARLPDGRFVVLCECGAGNRVPGGSGDLGLLFPSDPTRGTVAGQAVAFGMDGADAYRASDAAALPDGRVLVLLRRLAWPVPPQFDAILGVLDLRNVTEGSVVPLRIVARLGSLPSDNFEGLAVVPGSDGTLAVWIISDDNIWAFQRTLLLRLSVDARDID